MVLTTSLDFVEFPRTEPGLLVRAEASRVDA